MLRHRQNRFSFDSARKSAGEKAWAWLRGDFVLQPSESSDLVIWPSYSRSIRKLENQIEITEGI